MFNGFDLASMVFRIPALLLAISIHEYAHAQCADSFGDPTPRLMGRLTLNPLAHLDPIGALLLVVCGFGWAKPVSINFNNIYPRRSGMIKISVAGVAANLFLCFLAAFLMALMSRLGLLSDTLYRFFLWLQLYNVWFAFFNLVPIPPLDGYRLLTELLPGRLAWSYDNFVGRFGFWLLLALVVSGLIGWLINPPARLYMLLVNRVLGLIF